MQASDLPVCARCGWHALLGHEERCRPDLGRAADALAALVPETSSTKFGYGGERLAFDVGDDNTIIFDVCPEGFYLYRIFVNKMTAETAARFVRAVSGALDDKENDR